jgi:two-component system nitrogen regulation response regulator GlnG
VIGAGTIDAELAEPAVAVNLEAQADESLAVSVERHLSRYFNGFGDGLPPPGLYHRILREIETPLVSAVLAATRGNQIKAAELLGVNRNTLRKKIRDLDVRIMRGGR